jgi:hypothetical protein
MGVLADKVAEVAKGYIGRKELPNNSGFQDPVFQKKMEAVGWHKGESWCAYTAELIWKEAFLAANFITFGGYLDALFSGSAVATAANFQASPHFKTGKTPRKGALAIYRHGNSWQGHVGVVISVSDAVNYWNVEGNTNKDGGREGIEVADKLRKNGIPFQAGGLNLICFVYLPE